MDYVGALMKMIIKLSLLFCCCALQANFITLQDAQKFAAAYPENPKPDTNDYLNPVYKNTYRANAPRLWKRVLKKVGLYRKPLFSSKKFKELLIKSTAARENRGFKDRFVAGFMTEPNTEFVIFGDINGAFHSFVRDLTELKRMGYIDDTLKIIKPNCYFVFIGTNANRSPYTLETMDLLLSFGEKNPDNVIMARSRFMDKGYWSYFGMGSQLKEFAYMVSKENTPLETEVGNYFNTIALAFYLVTTESREHIARFSAYGRDNQELKERKFGTFFESLQPGKMAVWDTKNKEQTPKKVHIEELFRVPDRTMIYSPSKGLDNPDDEGGAEVWLIFSGPTFTNQKLHDFHYDAFAILNIGKSIRNSTISLYNRDIYLNEPFKLFFKKQLADISQNNFLVGSSIDLSSSLSGAGRPVNRGITTAFVQINEAGGIHGKDLQVYIMDDKYSPDNALKNYNTLYDEYGIRIFLSPVGSVTVLTLLDRMKSGDVFVAFPVTGSRDFRQPDIKGVVNLRASSADEVKALISYMVNVAKVKKIGFFFQDDAYGQGPLKIASEELKKHGFDKWVEIPYARGTTDFSKQVSMIRGSGIEALGLFSVSAQTREFIYQLDISSLVGIQLFSLSYVVDTNFMEFIKKNGLKVISAQTLPDPERSQVEIVKEYREAMDKEKIPYSPFSLEGYISTRLFGDIANKIEAPVTKEKLIEYVPTIKNYEWKGLVLNFNPETHELTNNVWINPGDGTPWIDAKAFIKREEELAPTQPALSALGTESPVIKERVQRVDSTKNVDNTAKQEGVKPLPIPPVIPEISQQLEAVKNTDVTQSTAKNNFRSNGRRTLVKEDSIIESKRRSVVAI